MEGAGLDTATLTVLLDVRHPFAYLALEPAIALGRSEGIAINWLPLAAPPLNAPSTPDPADDRGIRHRRARALALAREIETYATMQGLELRDYYRAADADAANLGWLWVRDRHPTALVPYLQTLFRAYWARELDASRTKDVRALIDRLDADSAGFDTWAAQEGPAAATTLDRELRDAGLFGVPAYVVADEVFYGRQHLPMIRWILGGRVGPGPI